MLTPAGFPDQPFQHPTTVAFTATMNIARTVCEPMLVYVALGDTLIEVPDSSTALATEPARTLYY